MKKLHHLLLFVSILIALMGTWKPAQAGNVQPALRKLPALQNKMTASLASQVNALQGDEMMTVIVTLRQQADLSRISALDRAGRQQAVIRALQSASTATPGQLIRFLKDRQAQGLIKELQKLWVFNGYSITANASVINELAQNSAVYSVTTDNLQIVPALAPAEANLVLVNAPAIWNQGNTGQGVVVANMDTGVDINHPDLSTRWRGGSNSWFDPYGQHSATPTDLNGHGTWTMGVMVGGDAGGTTIGIAPDAKWVAVKIFNDSGNSTATAIHLGFQWLLDPDSNPGTADAPNVVNNSWTFADPGCNLDFEPDLQSLRAAGILPVFAAGNGGPYNNTSFSPANNPSAFAVGAITNNSQIYAYSSRGPTSCGGSTGPFPELVAPGVNIRTTDLFSGYTSASGTSLAAPHVAGALALIISSHPNLSAADQQRALINSAVDLGAAGVDDIYGYGRLDVLAAFNWLASAPTPTSTAANTSTPLPTLTATATSTPMPTFTFTPSPTSTTVSATALHIGDLDRSTTVSGTKWNATVTIKVHNNAEGLIANASVTGKWTGGASGTITCTTSSSGICSVSKTGLSTKTASVTFTITNISLSPWSYSSTLNHDPDGDSNGTIIVVSK